MSAWGIRRRVLPLIAPAGKSPPTLLSRWSHGGAERVRAPPTLLPNNKRIVSGGRSPRSRRWASGRIPLAQLDTKLQPLKPTD
jgi:hypothetical protein